MFYQGPITYQGNKRRLMPQIKPLLKTAEVFVDLFCGSGTVGLNAPAETVVLNDLNRSVVELLRYLAETPYNVVYDNVRKLSFDYKLLFLAEGSIKRKEVHELNKGGYLRLREDYNREPSVEKLLVLVLYGFNKQVRFNRKGKFNNPPGDDTFNSGAQRKIKEYQKRAKEINLRFFTWDFRNWEHFHLHSSTMYYADPPYLITDAAYSAGWGEEDEKDLLGFLDHKNVNGDFFALSNVTETGGKKNELLLDWLNTHPEYKVHHLEASYNNSNYQRKNNEQPTKEVLVTNY